MLAFLVVLLQLSGKGVRGGSKFKRANVVKLNLPPERQCLSCVHGSVRLFPMEEPWNS